MILTDLPPRGTDGWGSGEFGAKRGKKKHNGIDFECRPGGAIYSPVDGVVTKIGYPYAGDFYYRYIQITDHAEMDHRIFYVEPEVEKGDVCIQNQTVIGYAQDIADRYNDRQGRTKRQIRSPMKNHVHYEIKADGEYINPG